MYANFNVDEYPLQEETGAIISVAYEVFSFLGAGLLEVVYKDAMEHEFLIRDMLFSREKEYSVSYKNIILKHSFFADFVIYNSVILEIKAKQGGISDEDYAQTINYLRISGCKVGLIINFGKGKVEIKRVIY